MKTLFDIDQVPLACPTCGSPIESTDDLRASNQCGECYVNAACPARCNGEHHAPTFRDGGGWQCPTEDSFWAMDGHYSEWCEDPYNIGAHLIEGSWYMEPYDHGYMTCAECGDWVHDDRASIDECGDTYCRPCFRDEVARTSSGRTCVPQCDGCGNVEPLTHYHPVFETVYCVACATGPRTAGLLPETLEPIPELQELIAA